MTPPLRLRERRLLPSLLRPISRTESLVFGPPFETTPHHSVSSLYSVAPSQGQAAKNDAASVKTASVGRSSFLSSPVCTPTARKLEPRQEKMPAHHHHHHQHSPKSAAAAALLRVASSSASAAGAEPPSPSSSSYLRLRSPPPASLAAPRRESQDDFDDDTSYISAKQSSPPRQRPGHRRGLTSTSASPPRGNRAGSGGHGNNGAGFGLKTYSSVSTASAASSSGDYYGGVGVGLAPPLFLHPNFSITPGATSTGNRDEQQQQYPHSYHRPTPPSSPMRPRRPHEEPLEIPDLVRPAAWPTPPLGGGIGVARTTATAAAQPQPQPQQQPPPPPQQQQQQQHKQQKHHRLSPLAGVSLQSLAEQHRDSWGSWGEDATPTGPGRMFGVSFPPGPTSPPGDGGGSSRGRMA